MPWLNDAIVGVKLMSSKVKGEWTVLLQTQALGDTLVTVRGRCNIEVKRMNVLKLGRIVVGSRCQRTSNEASHESSDRAARMQ